MQRQAARMSARPPLQECIISQQPSGCGFKRPHVCRSATETIFALSHPVYILKPPRLNTKLSIDNNCFIIYGNSPVVITRQEQNLLSCSFATGSRHASATASSYCFKEILYCFTPYTVAPMAKAILTKVTSPSTVVIQKAEI